MTKAISVEGRDRIVSEYSGNRRTMIELAGEYGLSRQGVWKILRLAGVDTRKRKLDIECYWCGGSFKRTKKRVRRNIRNFCSEGCYMEWLGEIGSDYIPSRHGQRIARGVVSGHFDLQPGHVVHHEDKNTLNNMLENLMVFSCNGDHVRYHRGVPGADPIWSGRGKRTTFFNPQPKGGVK